MEYTYIPTRIKREMVRSCVAALNFLNSEDTKPDLWLRFIDIFLLWTHGHDSLLLFLECLNSCYPVRVTWTISSSLVTFLDIDIFVDRSGFCTSVHIKSTNHQQYLHFSSCHTHPPNTHTFSQAICGRRICNHPSDLSSFTSNLTPAFASRVTLSSFSARFIAPLQPPYPKPNPFAP